MKPSNPKNKIHFQTKQFTYYVKKLKKKHKKKWLIIKKSNKSLFKFNNKSKRFNKFNKFYKINKSSKFNKFNFFYYKKKYKKYYYKKYLYRSFPVLKKYINIYFKYKYKNINLKNLILYLYLKKKLKKFIKFLIKKKFYKNKKKLFIQKKQQHRKKQLKRYSIKILPFLTNNKDFYKTTLHLKQLIKNINGKITTNKLKKIFKTFFLIKNKYNINFCVFLDSSIDNYLVTVGVARSIYEARQLIIHGKITINCILIKSCFIFLKPGDVFGLSGGIQQPIKQKLPPNIVYNKFLKNFIFIRYKNSNEIYYPFNTDIHLLRYSLKYF